MAEIRETGRAAAVNDRAGGWWTMRGVAAVAGISVWVMAAGARWLGWYSAGAPEVTVGRGGAPVRLVDQPWLFLGSAALTVVIALHGRRRADTVWYVLLLAGMTLVLAG